MKVHYQTDRNGVWDGVERVSKEDPNIPGWYQIPGSCYTDKPPDLSDKQKARRTINGWEVVDDYVGYVYWLADRTIHVIDQLGVRPPDEHLTYDPGPTLAERISQRQLDAKEQLVMNDLVAVRCMKSGIAYPDQWIAYDNELRRIVNSNDIDPDVPMPARPEYPKNY